MGNAGALLGYFFNRAGQVNPESHLAKSVRAGMGTFVGQHLYRFFIRVCIPDFWRRRCQDENLLAQVAEARAFLSALSFDIFGQLLDQFLRARVVETSKTGAGKGSIVSRANRSGQWFSGR